MKRKHIVPSMLVILYLFLAFPAFAAGIGELVRVIRNEVSGDRARDYTMRLWQYDKWNTFPMWHNTAKEARSIMLERGFDEAEIVETPADGVTRYSTWTNPIGWDVKHATLEIVEPAGLPDEYRILCDYRDNPSSLCFYSCPTPPGGLETELVLLDRSNEEGLKAIDARGKVVLVSSNAGGLKRHLEKYGVKGILSDQIESSNRDFVNANQWLNTWSDFPGGWLMTATDSREHFAFSISQKKGEYLRDLMREGRTVRVRASIDSHYFTDGSLPYITGCVKGTGTGDVLIVGHLFEWGANDNCTGSSSILEAVGTLNDLIREGALPRPKRSIRVWLGFELYGSMAYTVQNIDRLRNGTIACVCCDTPAENYDISTTTWNVTANFNACPSFTDAVFPEIAGTYYSRYVPYKNWKVIPFKPGRDNFFGDPMIGVPLNAVSLNNGCHLHHNSMDTIEKVDPRSLRDLSILNAAYLYFMADAGRDDVPFLANLAFDRAVEIIREKTRESKVLAMSAPNGRALGELQAKGLRTIEYYTDLQKQAITSIERVVNEPERAGVRKELERYLKDIDRFGENMQKHFRGEIKAFAKARSMKIARYKPEKTDRDREAESIVPRRDLVGPLTLEGIPVDKWREVRSSPRWWSSRNWGATSWFWCDGERNLLEIRELMEIEAGASIRNFDIVNYFRFLEEYDMVEFVK